MVSEFDLHTPRHHQELSNVTKFYLFLDLEAPLMVLVLIDRKEESHRCKMSIPTLLGYFSSQPIICPCYSNFLLASWQQSFHQFIVSFILQYIVKAITAKFTIDSPWKLQHKEKCKIKRITSRKSFFFFPTARLQLVFRGSISLQLPFFVLLQLIFIRTNIYK